MIHKLSIMYMGAAMAWAAMAAATAVGQESRPMDKPPATQGAASQPAGKPLATPDEAASQPAQGERWKLPMGMAVQPLSLRVLPQQGLAFLGQEELVPDQPPGTIYWMMELQSGKLSKVSDMLPADARELAVASVEPSPDGRRALIRTSDAKKRLTAAFVADLAGRKAVKIAESPLLLAEWSDRFIAMSAGDRKGMIESIAVVKPEGGLERMANITGVLACCDAAGKTWVVLCDPQKLTKSINVDDAVAAKVLAVDAAKGVVMREIGAASNVREKPVISAEGKFIAYQEAVRGQGADKKDHFQMRVAATSGNQERIIDEFGLPVWVSDSGDVLAVGAIATADGAPLKLHSAKGASSVLVEKACDAAVVGDKVFYVTGGDEPVLKSMPLPR